jgi:Protein of unknown function (DUF1629)
VARVLAPVRAGVDVADAPSAGKARSSKSETRRFNKKRRFYDIRSSWGRNGFKVVNAGHWIKTLSPFSHDNYFGAGREMPVFNANPKEGRIDRDFEQWFGFWQISDRMKTVLDQVDPEAFDFLQCQVQLSDGTAGPTRWLCQVVRILDAVDEAKSTVRIGTDSAGKKLYRRGPSVLVFKEDVVGSQHVFRMQYSIEWIVCDEEFRVACKSAGLTGIRFEKHLSAR